MHDEILTRLLERQATLTAQNESIFAAANNDNRDLTVDESAAIDAGIADFEQLQAQIERRETMLAQAEGVTARTTSTGRRSSPEPVRHRSPDGLEMPRFSQAGSGGIYARLFGTAGLGLGGFGSEREFFASLCSNRLDARLEAIKAGSTGAVGEQGGYLAPSLVAQMLLDDVSPLAVTMSHASVRPMTAREELAPAFDGLDRGDGTIFGFSGAWLGEGATATDQTARLRQVALRAHKLGIWTRATNELIEDAARFDNELRAHMAKAIAWHLDRAFIAGSGVGQPLGIRNDASKIVVEKETMQAPDTIHFSNITKMYSRMWSRGHGSAVWLANASTLPQLLTMQNIVVDPTAGIVGGQPAIRQEGEAFYLLGRPLILSEHLPLLGDEDDLMYVDFSQYLIGIRRQITVESSIAPGWQSDELAFRITTRVAGLGAWNAPSTPPNGATQTWCVTLAERA